MQHTDMTVACRNTSEKKTRINASKNPGNRALWWEAPLDEFTEMLQHLHAKYAPYFSRYEMEQVCSEVYQYTYQRGQLWESQIAMGISDEYLQYLADDLVGYLRHIYQFLKEDILDRKGEEKKVKAVAAPKFQAPVKEFATHLI